MEETERYLFDLNGYLVLRNVLSDDQVAAMNAALDAVGIPEQLDDTPYFQTGFPADGEPLGSVYVPPESPGITGPADFFNGRLTDWSQEFRDLVDHQPVLPYLEMTLGSTFRLDNIVAVLARRVPGETPTFRLHNGGAPFNPTEFYLVRDGHIFNSMIAISYALTDSGPSDGGFGLVPGSHKAAFPIPPVFNQVSGASYPVVQIPLRAGDAVIFTEATTHGALPWTAAHERRVVIYKYTPGHMQWEQEAPTRADHPWTDRQRQLLMPSYGSGRPDIEVGPRHGVDRDAVPAVDGAVDPRAAADPAAGADRAGAMGPR
jgi:hypothetical protein